MAQLIGNDGNHNQNGRYTGVYKALLQWKSKLNGECNDFHGSGGNHCDREERLWEVSISIASLFDQSLLQTNFQLLS